MNLSDKPNVDEIFTNLIGSGNRKEAKQALYQLLASEAVGVTVLDEDTEFRYDEAILISKLKEVFGIREKE